ncbi:AraC family transcriptional regulator [Mycolicibacterium smegmatis]|uniref:AraC-family transcriptional regulator n=3 Tax=Mycolicibacterium smegmatis TaxID=1772 RepID=I7GCM7_MYCS2|nr:AraC family transcriptional regulator [Mycolicibacterium smegmatis]ABK71404.1 transcriptional regulator, AraC family protein [Mycolicibacterium smegmatis MC2 155]AFP40991.1 AraC-family transcriptional regulator [Mycolicibacterium smegmatis MC2 155]AIU09715.1 AraC family transcriptional regulator [Mycolicibacterium smegmatis MC2 155]AIU16340.1 AraC family transcriptional regulator [Mycolicibacterium smegmatis]AIU22963.1 AraC family transcriptional regulator [Mycolicibacterium smegmatis]
MQTERELLTEICERIDRHARGDMHTRIDGLLLSKAAGSSRPDYTVTEPLLVVMARGGKRIMVGDEVYEYRTGEMLIVTASLPVTGHYLETDQPSLGMGLELRPAALAELALRAPARPALRTGSAGSAIAVGNADAEMLDAAARLLRLLDRPDDAPVLAPLVEQEILWRLLTGPHGDTVRQIALADSALTYINRAITWMRDNYASPVRIEDLARMAGMSTSVFHRHFRAVTAMSPLQFQKRIRLQQARSLLVSQPGDVAAVAHLVGYDSASQFTREYRRMFGAPPGQDAARLRAAHAPEPALLP